MKINVQSEIGKLNGVIVHTPGNEIENMTPENAERALYSDILNLAVASKEYSQFIEVLKLLTKTFEVKDLIKTTLENENAKTRLLDKICKNENAEYLREQFNNYSPAELSNLLIEGVPLKRNTLTKYFSEERYSLQPLHNFFFTRDASASINNKVLISNMHSVVRRREALIMEAIFAHHLELKTDTITCSNLDSASPNISFEGGDILMVRDDVFIIGNGLRTSTQGIDFIIDQIKKEKITSGQAVQKHIIVQQLPNTPESFIHLDMVFTILDTDNCMIYEPVILNKNNFKTVHITVSNGEVVSISEETNMLSALSKLGIDLKPINCGGSKDEWVQEREQWHSGANFFAIAPGQVLGYQRNVHTINEMNKNGYDIITAEDVISGKENPNNYKKVAITIAGAELSRGGGGCRCMTMPLNRDSIVYN